MLINFAFFPFLLLLFLFFFLLYLKRHVHGTDVVTDMMRASTWLQFDTVAPPRVHQATQQVIGRIRTGLANLVGVLHVL